MAIDKDDNRLVFVDVSVKKDQSTLYLNYWWIFDQERGAVFFKVSPKSKYLHPQCNISEIVAKEVRDIMYPWAQVVLIPNAYIVKN